MYKKAIISLTFLAYSLTLLHNVVPHHHHHVDDGPDHHHHGSQERHHHDDHDHDDNALRHVFSDAIHHPASETVIHAQDSDTVLKKNNTVDLLTVKLNELFVVHSKPPDRKAHYQEKFYPSAEDPFFLLRAPPIA